ncbi:Holliday junction resolvase MOC1, chloroplastic-like [Cyclospora cayetanensis]|uniref:Holliday junction resolvase MOC1, chloroplastic-like n=1 Tax=Cyclospora cayetanensis TaxID=88456 RepID=A0A6P6S030_9EIME|nr:Holliday junction resolvase MOC1, chloroplastic-like [Cyclospora cayetanensis]
MPYRRSDRLSAAAVAAAAAARSAAAAPKAAVARTAITAVGRVALQQASWSNAPQSSEAYERRRDFAAAASAFWMRGGGVAAGGQDTPAMCHYCRGWRLSRCREHGEEVGSSCEAGIAARDNCGMPRGREWTASRLSAAPAPQTSEGSEGGPPGGVTGALSVGLPVQATERGSLQGANGEKADARTAQPLGALQAPLLSVDAPRSGNRHNKPEAAAPATVHELVTPVLPGLVHLSPGAPTTTGEAAAAEAEAAAAAAEAEAAAAAAAEAAAALATARARRASTGELVLRRRRQQQQRRVLNGLPNAMLPQTLEQAHAATAAAEIPGLSCGSDFSTCDVAAAADADAAAFEASSSRSVTPAAPRDDAQAAAWQRLRRCLHEVSRRASAGATLPWGPRRGKAPEWRMWRRVLTVYSPLLDWPSAALRGGCLL